MKSFIIFVEKGGSDYSKGTNFSQSGAGDSDLWCCRNTRPGPLDCGVEESAYTDTNTTRFH